MSASAWQTAETTGYFVLGMVAIFGFMGAYVLWLRARARELRKEWKEWEKPKSA